MPTSEKVRLTDLLRAWRDGDQSAAETLFDALYSELRACAARYLGRERRDHTLQPTALVHEAYLRLAKQNDVNWQGREQFVAVAASMMRRVLVDHARAHGADKRGGDWERISIDLGHIEDLHNPADLLVLDAAVEELASVDPFQG
ncbi:MAG: ECF-type sigma factor, partial [Myxococcales bacterium]